jgi:hypothetical protein
MYLSVAEGSDFESLLPWIVALPLLSEKTWEIEEKIEYSQENLIPTPLLSQNYKPLSVLSEKHEGTKEEYQTPDSVFVLLSLAQNLTKVFSHRNEACDRNK